MVLDTERIMRFQGDPSGVVSIAHEFYHNSLILDGKEPALGDQPSSDAGPAEAFGRAVAAQRANMNQQQAQALLNCYLVFSPEHFPIPMPK